VVPSVTLAGVVLLTVLVGLLWRSRQGTVRAPRPAAAAVDWLARLHDAGVEPGPRGTFVQLSAEVCGPCRATARLLAAVAGAEPGVVHAELDVEAHPDLVRAARVLRTPTVVVLDDGGREVARSSGAMKPAQAQAALAALGTRATQDPTRGRTA
jgi:thiol-disulfide isomerase/thioredoxin